MILDNYYSLKQSDYEKNYKKKKHIFCQSFWEATDVTKSIYQEAEAEIQQRYLKVPSSLI